ncbi:MAG TPA: epoxide hydrolase [Dehalococcoidia bacterium]|jgi:pimeloyl-ACP methyl ester carboxylesterase|nr:epoxide hydrolase [Dehalococcoidia bacterium]
MDVQPFKIEVPEETLADLKERLAQTRWPDELPGTGWDYGTNMAYLKELVDYWQNSFDWRAQEEAINRFSHFKADVDGLGIHFIHQKGVGPDPMPLVLTHGWPGSFFEMSKITPLLADPASHGGDAADAFHVVTPSMPGYGFSDHPTKPGMHVLRVSDLWVKLMKDGLGYDRFGAQGGDWGASVTAYLGFAYPENLIGIHLTSMVRPTPYMGPGSTPLSEAEQALLKQREEWMQAEGGYSHIQGTKPQTLSYGLNDSPVGLAAWLVEKYRSWSDCGGDVESRFTKDELLTTITIYWAAQIINSSTRLYYETARHPWDMKQGERISVPAAMAVFPGEISLPPREWGERSYNVQRWTEMPCGGHFAALEEPERLAEDIRAFFRPLRN